MINDFELRSCECRVCGIIIAGQMKELMEHLKTDENCKALQKKKEEDYKKSFENWKLAIKELNDFIKMLNELTLDEKDIKIEMGFLTILDDKKGYKDDEEHEMIVFLYGYPEKKVSTYEKEREIFRRFDKAKTLFKFEKYKRKLIRDEKNKLFEKKVKEDIEKENQMWTDYVEEIYPRILEDVEREFKKPKS